jgi:hypothetical protein
MQFTFNPFDLTAEQATLVADFIARAAGVIPVSDRPDVGAPTPAPEVPQFSMPPTLPAAEATSPSPALALPSAPEPAADPDAKDASGLKWDERIHAGNRATNGDGTWRKKRGVEPALVLQVEAELRGVPVPPSIPAVPAAPAVPSAAELAARMMAPVAPAVPAAPVAPAVPAAPVAPAVPAAPVAPAVPAAPVADFPTMVQTLVGRMPAEAATWAVLWAQNGLPMSLPEYNTATPEQIAAAMTLVG